MSAWSSQGKGLQNVVSIQIQVSAGSELALRCVHCAHSSPCAGERPERASARPRVQASRHTCLAWAWLAQLPRAGSAGSLRAGRR